MPRMAFTKQYTSTNLTISEFALLHKVTFTDAVQEEQHHLEGQHHLKVVENIQRDRKRAVNRREKVSQFHYHHLGRDVKTMDAFFNLDVMLS